jgi:alpha-D-ribose 1-methylphosphonate 5-triphosphate synthase subunit PhnI
MRAPVTPPLEMLVAARVVRTAILAIAHAIAIAVAVRTVRNTIAVAVTTITLTIAIAVSRIFHDAPGQQAAGNHHYYD